MGAKAKVKTESAAAEKALKSPTKSPAKSPAKPKKDAVKKSPMKTIKKAPKKAGGANEAPKHPAASKMTAQAFVEMKNRKGHTMSAIRNYIAKQFDVKVNKAMNTNIKKFIRAEVEAGRMKMVGAADEEAEVKFVPSTRFALVK